MIKADDIILSPLLVGDAVDLFRWINDRDNVLRNSPYKPVTEGQHKAWFESIQQRNDVVIFGIRLRSKNKLIGSCQLHAINFVHRTAEVQIRLGEASESGRGYGTQAICLLVQFAFHDLNLNRLYLHVFCTNKAAIRVYEKVGFVREGLLRKAAHINGEYIDLVVMGLLREEHGK